MGGVIVFPQRVLTLTVHSATWEPCLSPTLPAPSQLLQGIEDSGEEAHDA